MNGRNILLDLLACLFGISSWVSINGLWVELPLLVQRLPEFWKLPSYLSVIVQVANLGPITYAILKWLTKGKVSDKLCICLLLSIGTTSGFLLSQFWSEVVTVVGQQRSLALFILVFCLSMVDCTSSILFMPFMAVFRDIYLNSYLVGEGLSGFIPSIAALAQGVGGNPECKNVTVVGTNDSNVMFEMKQVSPEPNFSVEAFFDFLAGMMALSFLSFILMNLLPSLREEHASRHQMIANSEVAAVREELNVPPTDGDTGGGQEDRENVGIRESGDRHPAWLPRRQRNLDLSEEQKTDAKSEFYTLLFIQAFVCFLSNGALPSIQTYSCLPFGNLTYHLSVTLHAMANPTMAFAAFFVPTYCTKKIKWLTLAGLVFVVFIFATAFHSPNMLFGQYFGGFLTVASWVIYGGLFSYVKVSVAGKCRQISSSALFWCGAITQVGSALGAGLMFGLVQGNIFEAYYVNCSS